MYSYTKKKKFPERRLIVSLGCPLIAAIASLTYEYSMKSPARDTSVFKEDTTPVLSLPNSAEEERDIQPFATKAEIILDYFDGKDSKVDSMTKLEGVYQANQGMNYSSNKKTFDVLANSSSEVNDVKGDDIFDRSVTITSKDLSITYRSLSDITVKKGDKINQKDPVAKARSNIYNKELDNHLHTVVEKDSKIIDPELVYGKTNARIK